MTLPETILEALYGRLSADGTVQAPRDVLAAENGCSARTVDRILKQLRDLGHIETVTGGRFGSPTVYRMEQPHSATPPVDNLVDHSATQRADHSATPQNPSSHSAPTEEAQVTQRDTENPQVTQRATKTYMCMARCGYPLDPTMSDQGDTMHAWCSLGVTSATASDRVKIAAIRQDHKDTA